MDRQEFQDLTGQDVTPSEILSLATSLRQGFDPAKAQALVASLAHAAFAAPWRVVDTYDAAATGWLGDFAAPDLDLSPARAEPSVVSADLWCAFWALIEGTGKGRSALEFTAETAALSQHLAPTFLPASVAVSLHYPGVREAAALGYPPHITLQELAACSTGSIGRVFHDLLVENGFDIEVLDRDALGLRDLPSPLDYLNARILQCHDLWHIAAGYETTGLHEIGISAFQLAQFGHAYSAMVLAVTLTLAAREPMQFEIMMTLILSAWRHGRQAPALIGVDWPNLWNDPVEGVRSRLGLSGFESPYPPALFEMLQAAA